MAECNRLTRIEVELARHSAELRALAATVKLHTKYQERAVHLAHAVQDERLHKVNEFRAALSDQAARMVTRVEIEGKFKAMDDALDSQRNQMHAQQSILSNWIGRMVGAGAIVVIGSGLISLAIAFWGRN